MIKSEPATNRIFDALATLLLSQPPRDTGGFAREITYISNLNREQMWDLLKKAETQRVLCRTLEVLRANLPDPKQDSIDELLDALLLAEQQRVEKALACLQIVVNQFAERGHSITVMKTLDHWPDTGNDLDLLVDADDQDVCQIFENEFHAIRQPQSWGDRLAHKFNFRIPNLRELVEVHVGCLGQTGEQKALAAGVLSRRRTESYATYSLPVPSSEDRIVIATLQRMYRHYYIRLTDIVNIFGLLSARRVDFERLKAMAEVGSVWPGVATLLSVVSQHAVRYGARAIVLPDAIVRAARFNSNRTYLGRDFVRVPLMPEAANLFLHQLAENGRCYNFRAVARLSLLPVLATAAFVSFQITGDDKGIW